jgi:hypothetical protein
VRLCERGAGSSRPCESARGPASPKAAGAGRTVALLGKPLYTLHGNAGRAFTAPGRIFSGGHPNLPFAMAQVRRHIRGGIGFINRRHLRSSAQARPTSARPSSAFFPALSDGPAPPRAPEGPPAVPARSKLPSRIWRASARLSRSNMGRCVRRSLSWQLTYPPRAHLPGLPGPFSPPASGPAQIGRGTCEGCAAETCTALVATRGWPARRAGGWAGGSGPEQAEGAAAPERPAWLPGRRRGGAWALGWARSGAESGLRG